jgi:hypothetical protein
VQLPPPESLPSDWDDSPLIAAARERLEAQKKVTAKVRKMVSSCPAFKELRLVKSAQAKLAAQIEKLEAKAARLRQRIASIEPSGWKEFVRVVQVRGQGHVYLSLFFFRFFFFKVWATPLLRALRRAGGGGRSASRSCRRACRANNVDSFFYLLTHLFSCFELCICSVLCIKLCSPSDTSSRTFQKFKHVVARLRQRIESDGGWVLRKIMLCHQVSYSIINSPLSVVVFLIGSSTRWHGIKHKA